MTQYLNLFENIIMSGVSRKQDKFQGNVTVFEGCGGFSGDGFTIHRFCGMPIRVKMVDGEPWFCLSDVCAALELTAKGVRQRLEKDVISNYPLPTRGGNQLFTFVNEDGLYDTILESRKPEAKAFRKWITKEVLPTIRKTGGYGNAQIPDFMQRVILNAGQIPLSHFSVIGELFSTVYCAFEKAGHRLSDKAINGVRLRPDVSVGKCFSAWLKKNGYDPEDDRMTYEHKFPDGYSVNAYAYPNKMLGVFRDFVYQEWLPVFAPKYLKDKDPRALEYLPRLLDNRKAS